MRLILLTIISFLAFTNFIYAQDSAGSIQHDGITRNYLLHLPTGYNSSNFYPLVFNLHGYTSNATEQLFYSGMNATADQGNFIVCYPNGIANSWNVGLPGGSSANDVGFLENLIDSLASAYSINTDRVYSCGMSNGGFMSYKLACELGNKIAAIASVTGAMVPGEFDNCAPYRKTPVLEIHGTADLTVPYNGTAFINEPIEDVINFWVENNGCPTEPEITMLEDISTIDLCTAETQEYLNCEEDSEVILYKIIGGGHTWPGSGIAIGVTNQDFNASAAIWEFFNRFDINGSIVSSIKNETQLFDIQLFPNPASSEITLNNLPLDLQSITIVDAYGRLIDTFFSTNNLNQNINISNLPKGVYWVNVLAENSRGVVKFVKQ